MADKPNPFVAAFAPAFGPDQSHIDSVQKRQNIPGVGRPWLRANFPVATPDEEWRLWIGNVYGGNPLTAIVVTVEAVGAGIALLSMILWLQAEDNMDILVLDE